MSKQQELKRQEVAEIVKALNQAKSFILFEYTTLTGKEITQLRKELHGHNASMHVYKNTLLRRALEQVNIPVDEKLLQHANAIIFVNDDSVDAFKDFAKLLKDRETAKPEAKKIPVKAGLYEKNLIDGNMVLTIASLPSRKDLYSMLACVLNAPLTNLAYAIKQIAEKQPATK